MKVLLSILLGMMLLTSLAGFSYATPISQPPQPLGNNSSRCQPSNNNQYSNATECESNSGGNAQHDPQPCAASKAPDGACLCSGGISPHGSEISATCCVYGITPQSAQVSDIGPDCLR